MTQIVCLILYISGFNHEHQRPDRDEYIDILYENIANDRGSLDVDDKYNLDKQKDFPYDFCSVAHYSRFTGSRVSSFLPLIEWAAKLQEDKIVGPDRMQLDPLALLECLELGKDHVGYIQLPSHETVVWVIYVLLPRPPLRSILRVRAFK